MIFNQLTEHSFGAIVEDFDCASINEESAEQIRLALYQHQLLVFPGQQHLSPSEEVIFHRKVDPDAQSIWRDQLNNPWERFKVEQGNTAGTYQIPNEPGVLVLGKGNIDHFGLKVTLGGNRRAYGNEGGSQVLGGGALQWHIDGTFYEHDPCLFTQMRCVEAPQGKGHWLNYDDGTDARLWCDPGSTAFASGRVGFNMLNTRTQDQASDTKVHYMCHPFQMTHDLSNNSNGLRVLDPDAEKLYAAGGEPPGQTINDPAAKVYPLVWTCPVTKEKALMPQPRCMDHLEYVSEKQHLGKTESRLQVEELMRPGIEPKAVYVHSWRNGDLVIWNNRSMWHSATGKLSKEDRRIQHLTAFNSSRPPC